MQLNLGRTLISVGCFLAASKLMFLIFSPAEIWTMIGCVAIPFLMWSIQPVEYTRERSVTFLIPIFRSTTHYRKTTLFGIIPIGSEQVVKSDLAIGPKAEEISEVFETIKTALPFNGALKAIGK